MSLRGFVFGAALAMGVGASAAAQAGQGSANVDAVLLQDSVVVLNGRAFRVSEQTAISGHGGEKLTLAEVPSRDRGASLDETAAYYESLEESTQGKPLLYRLELTGRAPR
jgi:hypothetical protein